MATLLAPRYWLVHLVALSLAAAALWLGQWQYDAWQTRRDLEAVDLTSQPPVPLTDVLGPDDPFPGTSVGQPVTVRGTWVPLGTVFVSGREQAGQSGFWVVTPLAVTEGPDPAVPVVRGWVADRADAPPAPQGPATVAGWLQPPEGSGDLDPDPTDDVVPEVRVADLIQHVDQDLYGAFVVAADPATAASWSATTRNDGTQGLAPASLASVPEVGRFTALRNLLYALEWWLFGAFAVFVWVRHLRDELEHDDRRAGEEPVASGP